MTSFKFIQKMSEELNNFYTISLCSLALIKGFIASSGILMNILLVYVIIRNKNLQSITGILLAIFSASDAIGLSASILPAFLVPMQKQILFMACFWLQIPSLSAIQNACFCMLFISIDRFLIVWKPIFYRNVLNKRPMLWILGLNILSISFCTLWAFLAFKDSQNYKELMVYCNPGDILKDESSIWNRYLGNSTTLCSIAFYILIWIRLKTKINNASNHFQNVEEIKRIMKSLTIIMAFIFFCFFGGMILMYIFSAIFKNNPQMLNLCMQISIQIMIFNQVVTAPILYICSSEYRNAINNEFPPLKWFKKELNKTTVIQVQSSIFHNKIAFGNLD